MTTIWPGTTYTGDAPPYKLLYDIGPFKAGQVVGPNDTWKGKRLTEWDAAASDEEARKNGERPEPPKPGLDISVPPAPAALSSAGTPVPGREGYIPPRVTGTPPQVTAAVRPITPAAGIMPKTWMPPTFQTKKLGKRTGRSTPTKRRI